MCTHPLRDRTRPVGRVRPLQTCMCDKQYIARTARDIITANCEHVPWIQPSAFPLFIRQQPFVPRHLTLPDISYHQSARQMSAKHARALHWHRPRWARKTTCARFVKHTPNAGNRGRRMCDHLHASALRACTVAPQEDSRGFERMPVVAERNAQIHRATSYVHWFARNPLRASAKRTVTSKSCKWLRAARQQARVVNVHTEEFEGCTGQSIPHRFTSKTSATARGFLTLEQIVALKGVLERTDRRLVHWRHTGTTPSLRSLPRI